MQELRPAVVAKDNLLPHLDGIRAPRRLIASVSASRVLMLTTFDADQHVCDAFQAGASGFLLKNAPEEQLVAAVHAVAAGDAPLAPDITRRMIERFMTRPTRGEEAAVRTLTDREAPRADDDRPGLSNGEIADELYLSTGTVKTHVNES